MRKMFLFLGMSLITVIALLIAGCSSEDPVETEVTSNPAVLARAPGANAPVIQSMPEENPGPPWYANFGGDFIPNDGEWTSIVFMHQPGCVPPDFNLLDMYDPPGVFSCPLTIEGELWWYDPDTDPFPFQVHIRAGEGGTPVYFVKMSDLETAMADSFLNMDELESLPSLLIGSASFLHCITHDSNQGNRSFGNEQLTAKGSLEDGRSFQFHYNEKGVYIDDHLVHIFSNVEIKFN